MNIVRNVGLSVLSKISWFLLQADDISIPCTIILVLPHLCLHRADSSWLLSDVCHQIHALAGERCVVTHVGLLWDTLHWSISWSAAVIRTAATHYDYHQLIPDNNCLHYFASGTESFWVTLGVSGTVRHWNGNNVCYDSIMDSWVSGYQWSRVFDCGFWLFIGKCNSTTDCWSVVWCASSRWPNVHGLCVSYCSSVAHCPLHFHVVVCFPMSCWPATTTQPTRSGDELTPAQTDVMCCVNIYCCCVWTMFVCLSLFHLTCWNTSVFHQSSFTSCCAGCTCHLTFFTKLLTKLSQRQQVLTGQ